ncbi:MAG: DUF3971 domain-containing protein, partial [Burkholderiales bacterium]
MIDEGSIQWRDEARAAPPLELRSVSLRFVNRFGNHHRIALRAVPPVGVASPLDVRADLRGESLEALATWSGSLYADIDYAEFGAWRAWLDYPVNVTAGRGRVRAWFDVADGRITHATADVALSGVEARLARDLPPLRLDSVSGRLGIAEGRPGRGFLGIGREQTQSVSAFGQALALAQRGVAPVAPFDFTVRWEPASDRSPERGDARATRIDLAPLAALAESLPLPRAVRDALGGASPRGRLTDMTFGWTGPIEGPDTYRARAQFADLAMKPVGLVPGVGPLAGVLQMTEGGGNIKLEGTNVNLDFPRLFKAGTIPAFETVSAQVDWTLTPRAEGEPQLEVRAPAFKLANADFAASGAGSWRALALGPGQLELAIDVPRAKATAVHRYMAFLPERSYEWLKRSLQAGEGTDGRIRFKGDLIAFPYATPKEGRFQITTRFTGGQLQFHPEWPKIEGIDGEVAIDGRALSVKGQAGVTLGVKLGPSTVQIAELLGPLEAIVEANSTAEGPTPEFRKFILESPLRENIGRVLADMSGDGLGRIRFGLTVPLRRIPETRVQGSYQFVGNRVSVAPDQPPFTDVNGQLEFTERTLSANGLTGQFLGGPASLSIATQPNS